MVRYAEKRDEYREVRNVPILVQELDGIFIYSARMVNFNYKGAYFETDTTIKVGKNVIVGIEDSSFNYPSTSPDSPKFFNAKILWKKNLMGGLFNFGYGTKLIHFHDQQNVKETNSLLRHEYRKHPRKLYPKPVIFSSMDQYFKGSIRNISLGGAFIETRDKFKAGQKIKLIIPGNKIDSALVLKAEVLRFNQSGVGIIFYSIIK